MHLNPWLALWIGDALLSAVEDNRNVLVETHSEHIVLRLRRRIAEGRFSGDKMALYFARRSLEEGSPFWSGSIWMKTDNWLNHGLKISGAMITGRLLSLRRRWCGGQKSDEPTLDRRGHQYLLPH